MKSYTELPPGPTSRLDEEEQTLQGQNLENSIEAVPLRLVELEGTHEYKVRLASAKLIGSFVMKDRGAYNLEKGSVYGAAILLPQLARTAGWPKFLTFLTIRSYIFHILNIIVQGWLLMMISKEESVMDLFAGQMYLCDFGAFVNDCPGGPGCTGPGGTQVTAPRMYPWEQWVTRLYVRDSLKALFPEKADEIAEKVDPGEYGVESYGCRLLCCFIYMLTVMNELYLIFKMVTLLWYVPAKAEPWIEHVEGSDHLADWLDCIQLKVGGMPRFWKAFNVAFVLVPKVVLWILTAESGVTLLMETSGIEDLIVNSVALSFVLSIDEMICETMMSDASKAMLDKCEDFTLYDEAAEDALPDEAVLAKYGEQQKLKYVRFIDIPMLFPPKLLVVLLMTATFVFLYYYDHCDWSEEHRFFSKKMYLPQSVRFSFLQAAFSRIFRVESASEPFWKMPDVVQ